MFISKTIIMLAILGIAYGQVSPTDVPFRRYCSAALSEAIKLICGSNYNSYSRRIRDSNSDYYASTIHRKSTDSVLLRRLVDENYTWYRTHVGATHECCRRPCGYTELKGYCAPD